VGNFLNNVFLHYFLQMTIGDEMIAVWRNMHDMGYPNYSVSNMGDVRNDNTDRIIKPSYNNYGLVRVGLVHEDGYQGTVGIAYLVASYFLLNYDERATHVINLDGDRTNNAVENLAWRPQWFAQMYHRQFLVRNTPRCKEPIFDVNDGAIYNNSWEACRIHGLLDRDVLASVISGREVYPTRQTFAWWK
jgi:predicted secreted protein